MNKRWVRRPGGRLVTAALAVAWMAAPRPGLALPQAVASPPTLLSPSQPLNGLELLSSGAAPGAQAQGIDLMGGSVVTDGLFDAFEHEPAAESPAADELGRRRPRSLVMQRGQRSGGAWAAAANMDEHPQRAEPPSAEWIAPTAGGGDGSNTGAAANDGAAARADQGDPAAEPLFRWPAQLRAFVRDNLREILAVAALLAMLMLGAKLYSRRV